jgi:hypothetical protein
MLDRGAAASGCTGSPRTVTGVVTLRTRVAHCRGPVIAAALAAAGFVLVALVDPYESGRYPPCPWHALTGLWCPGCGGLRAAHDLAHADLAAAAGSNALAVALVPAAAVLWWRWLAQRWRGETAAAPSLSPGAMVGVLIVAMIFTIARNLPAGAVLAP